FPLLERISGADPRLRPGGSIPIVLNLQNIRIVSVLSAYRQPRIMSGVAIGVGKRGGNFLRAARDVGEAHLEDLHQSPLAERIARYFVFSHLRAPRGRSGLAARRAASER